MLIAFVIRTTRSSADRISKHLLKLYSPKPSETSVSFYQTARCNIPASQQKDILLIAVRN
jgi:hypothetical protein